MSKPVASAARSLGTLAAAASAVSLPGAATDAHAQGVTPFATPTTVSWSVEGGFLFSKYSRSAFPNGPTETDKLASLDSLSRPNPGNNTGFFGAASFSKSIDGVYDWRVTAAFNVFKANNWSSSSSSSGTSPPIFGLFETVTERDKLAFTTFDFDIGRRYDQGDLHLRPFAGIRVLHARDTFNSVDTLSIDSKIGQDTLTNTLTGKSTFTGAGPRVGLDMFYGSTWGVVGSVSGAGIFGARRSDVTQASPFQVKGAPLTSWSDRSTDWVGNLSGSIGIAGYLSQNSMVTLGYRVDGWFNLRDKFAFTPIDFNRKEDITTHTVFLRVQVKGAP